MKRALAWVGLTLQDVKMAVRSGMFAFLAVLVPGLLSWLNAMTQWAPGKPFPDTSSLGTLAISGIVAGLTALVTLLWRAVEGKVGKGFLRPNPPKVTKPPKK